MMQEWWIHLAGVTRLFYGMAAFFSVFFLWQILAAFMGLSGDDADIVGDTDLSDLDSNDVVESSQAFKILSLRSIITFFTLFSWGSALYTADGMLPVRAMGIASLWGLAGMLAIAGIFYGMGKLTETGTKDMASCKGQTGTVYLDIPSGGYGEIKTVINGVPEHVKAKNRNEAALPAGTQVRIVNVIDQTLVEVEKITE
jgi:hypothetical protein